MQILPFKKKGASDNKKEALKLADKVNSDLERYYKQFEPNWKAEENLYYGDIFNNPKDHKPYENYAFQTIEDITAILTDSDPVPVVKTNDTTKKDQVNNLGESLKYVFKDQCISMKRTQAIKNGLVSAPGYIYVDYDHNANNGDGQNTLEVLRRDQAYLDGAASDISKSRKCVIYLDRDKEWLKLKYPDKKDIIDKLHGDKTESQKNRPQYETRDFGDTRHRNKVPNTYKDDDLLRLRIVYVKDYSVVKIPEKETIEELKQESEALSQGDSPDVNLYQDHKMHIEAHATELEILYRSLGLETGAGIEAAAQVAEQMQEKSEVDLGETVIKIKLLEDHIEAHGVLIEENPKGVKQKYPGAWRVIESIDNKLLRDGKHRHNHLRIPLAVYYGNKDGTAYGFSECKNIYDPETMRAVMAYKEFKGLQLVANPQVMVSFDSQLDKDSITNEDGAVYEVEDIHNSIKHFLPGQVSPQVENFQIKRQAALRDITGVSMPSQEKMPHHNSSGYAIQRLQNQAVGRFRLKTRLYESHSDPQLAYLICSDIMQFWVNEKILKVEDEAGDSRQVIFNPLDMADLQWEVEMQAGSMAGVDKDAFNNLLFTHLQAGLITPQIYWDNAEIPKTQNIKQAMMENDTQMQEVQAQMEQMQMQTEQINAELQGTQIENLKLKKQLEIQTNQPLLSNEENKILEQVLMEETIQQLPTDQPVEGVENEDIQ